MATAEFRVQGPKSGLVEFWALGLSILDYGIPREGKERMSTKSNGRKIVLCMFAALALATIGLAASGPPAFAAALPGSQFSGVATLRGSQSGKVSLVQRTENLKLKGEAALGAALRPTSNIYCV